MRIATMLVAGALMVGGASLVPCVPQAVAAEMAGPKVDLRPKFKQGQQTRFKMTLDTSGKQTGGSEADDLSSKQEIGLLLKVKDTSADGGANLELVYESIKMKMNSGLMNIDFDSSKPAKADDPMDAVLRPIVGLTLNVKMDKDGNITSVDSGGAGAGPAAQVMQQFTGADVIKNMFGPIMTARKGSGEAAVGESWTNEDVIDGAMAKLKITTTNTLKSHTGGKALIDIRGKISAEPSASGGNTPQVKINDSSITGQATWDTEAGMLAKMQSQQKLSIERLAEGQKTSTQQTMNLTVERVNK